MKAMIFAAGRGTRMGALTEDTPKPLLRVRGRPLIDYTLERLAEAGVREVVVNVAYLGEQIQRHLGDGSAWGLSIAYSEEPYPLETGGAVYRALPLLGEDPFLIVNADVWTDFPLEQLVSRGLVKDELGHLVMVVNPDYRDGGDYGLSLDGSLIMDGEGETYTYSGVSVLHPRLVADYPKRREAFPLGEVFASAIEAGRLSGQLYEGEWRDIGTPERLAALERLEGE